MGPCYPSLQVFYEDNRETVEEILCEGSFSSPSQVGPLWFVGILLILDPFHLFASEILDELSNLFFKPADAVLDPDIAVFDLNTLQKLSDDFLRVKEMTAYSFGQYPTIGMFIPSRLSNRIRGSIRTALFVLRYLMWTRLPKPLRSITIQWTLRRTVIHKYVTWNCISVLIPVADQVARKKTNEKRERAGSSLSSSFGSSGGSKPRRQSSSSKLNASPSPGTPFLLKLWAFIYILCHEHLRSMLTFLVKKNSDTPIKSKSLFGLSSSKK